MLAGIELAALDGAGVHELALTLMLVLVLACVAGGLVFSLGARLTARSAVLRAVEEKVAGSGHDELDGTDLPSATTRWTGAGIIGFVHIMDTIRGGALAIAERCGVRVAPLAPVRAAVLLVPVALLACAYVPILVMSISANEQASAEARRAAATTVSAVSAALEDGGCAYVSADDPLEHEQSYGYSVRGYLNDPDDGDTSLVSVSTDERDVVCQVGYSASLDPALDDKEEVDRAGVGFARLRDMLAALNVPCKPEGLLAVAPELPADVAEELASGGYAEEVSASGEGEGGGRVFVTYTPSSGTGAGDLYLII